MINQIIFFLALAAFIIIFARRYSLSSHSLRKIGRLILGVTDWMGEWLKMIGRPKFGRQISKRPKLVVTSSLPDQIGTPVNSDFWASEALADKLEISSHFEEGEQLFKSGKHREAEQFFLKAAANNPGEAKTYARLGLLYLEQKNYSDAIESLKMAAKLEKYNPSRHYNLALAYWGNKDTRRAISSARAAIGLDPVTGRYRKLLEQLLNG